MFAATPIVEDDPWRKQYFEHVVCPDSVFISTDDTNSYALYPEHRWVYNKLAIAESQHLACAPHRIVPSTFYEDRPPELRSMRPGGFRIAIVNCWNLDVGREVCKRLEGVVLGIPRDSTAIASYTGLVGRRRPRGE